MFQRQQNQSDFQGVRGALMDRSIEELRASVLERNGDLEDVDLDGLSKSALVDYLLNDIRYSPRRRVRDSRQNRFATTRPYTSTRRVPGDLFGNTDFRTIEPMVPNKKFSPQFDCGETLEPIDSVQRRLSDASRARVDRLGDFDARSVIGNPSDVWIRETREMRMHNPRRDRNINQRFVSASLVPIDCVDEPPADPKFRQRFSPKPASLRSVIEANRLENRSIPVVRFVSGDDSGIAPVDNSANVRVPSVYRRRTDRLGPYSESGVGPYEGNLDFYGGRRVLYPMMR